MPWVSQTQTDFDTGVEDQGSTREAAEAYLEALSAAGIECLFLNPGTDTFPIQEAAIKLTSQGRQIPRIVLCLFEVVALAAAHGYYAATGKPQAVLVHVDVGTQNLGAMLHNAQRGRAAVLIGAGRAPYTTDPTERGSRNSYIHWLQEQMDQHGIVRNYVKWDYEIRRPDQIGEVIARARQIAASDPPGPVYFTLPREVLMASIDDIPSYPAERHQPVSIGAGNPQAIDRAAQLLVDAERPLILTADVGREPEAWQELIDLVDQLAIPVIEWRNRANFPSDHPLHLGYDASKLLPQADVVLVLDSDYPYIPTMVQPPEDAKIIQIDLDPVKERIPLWTFPVDLPIRARSALALPMLRGAAERLLNDAKRAVIDQRRSELAEGHERLQQEWEADRDSAAEESPISLDWVGSCLREFQSMHPDAIFVDEMVTSNARLWRHVPTEEPGTWFGSGGSGLGWGLGAALGVKLANPGRPVISVVGDGSFMFGAPVAALWAAARQAAPFIVVILNNTCYNATKSPLVASYPEGYSVREDRFVGVDLLPPPRYDLLAEAAGGHGQRVEDPQELPAALRRAQEAVEAGQPAVVDVLLAHP